MIRLSTAHAKMRMSKYVDIIDATVAIDIMRFVVEAEGLGATASTKLDDRTSEIVALESAEEIQGMFNCCNSRHKNSRH